MSKKQNVQHNNVKQTWQNTAKEQPYLMPGTAEYEEYQEDLMQHDPFRPNDTWHDDLEEANTQHSVALKQKDESHIARKSEGKRNYQNHIMKETQFKKVKHELIEQAKQTETDEDDKKAKRAVPKHFEKLIYDNGVTQDDFLPKALKKYE